MYHVIMKVYELTPNITNMEILKLQNSVRKEGESTIFPYRSASVTDTALC